MSLPDGFLEELRQRLSLSQVVGRKVIWDAKKSNTAKGDMWSPCPFHQEKTASFHVDDRKGFYYCFGCHEKGDAINFVRETENVSFIEAVEILAREAGMTMPARDPRAQEKIDRNKVLVDVMEQAVRFYRMQLNSSAGAAARDYLDQRGLPQETQNRFEIGFVPEGWDGLANALRSKGVTDAQLIETGMAIESDKGKPPYDRFRNRIMFPIRDPRGRCIGFGGRAMDPNDRAKYLNSPETTLFDKGRSLYHHGPAREASGKTGQLIVAEGYMDVIALAQYGFDHAVAPLGTAITENQLALLWRVCPEPIIALDGDKAGIRAAMRLIDLALPLLEPGKSLRFCLMPQGQDPDDLLKAKGAPAMQELLDNAQPMVKLLWQRETEGKVFDSPERRAALDADLRKSIMLIKDKSLRSHYGSAINELRRALFAPNRSANQTGKWRPKMPDAAMPDTKSSLLARNDAAVTTRLRGSVILMAAMLNPKSALKNETKLEKCNFPDPDLTQIQNALLANLSGNIDDTDQVTSAIETSIGFDPKTYLRKLKALRDHPYLQDTTDAIKVERVFLEELDKYAALVGSAREIQEAEQDLAGLADEGLTWRLQQAAEARVKAVRAEDETEAKDDEQDALRKQQLQDMIDGQAWLKKKL